MKRGWILALAAAVLFPAFSAVTATAEEKDFIENDFLNDLEYYTEHFEAYKNANWRFCFGEINDFYDMSYFAGRRRMAARFPSRLPLRKSITITATVPRC